MKNETNLDIFHQAFDARVKASAALVGAITDPQHGAENLNEACLAFEASIAELDQGSVEDQYRAYSYCLNIFSVLAQWKRAILNAEPDNQRFLSSAKLKVSEIDKSLSFTTEKQLNIFLNQISELKTVKELPLILNHLKTWSLPLLIFANIKDHKIERRRPPSTKTENLDTSIAFLKFNIDNKPAGQCNYLKPETFYDLTIEVRVSNWPKGATTLTITPITMDTEEQGWLPTFRFCQPEGNGPFILTDTGRAILKFANSLGSRPYEFLYTAEFDNAENQQCVSIVGHRRLLIEGCDVSSNPISGYSNVDSHLLKIRNDLRKHPGLQPSEISNTMTILAGLGNIAAQALKSGMFDTDSSEKSFQMKVTEMLSNRNDIGERLLSHPGASGGITDLTFQDIPIELKVDKKKVLYPKDYSKFFNQTAAYAIALGKRVGFLCVLDVSHKTDPLGVIEDDIELFIHPSGESRISILVVLIRGGFPKPSFYSK